MRYGLRNCRIITSLAASALIVSTSAYGDLFTAAGRMWRSEVDQATLDRLNTEILHDPPRQAEAERVYEQHVERFQAFIEESRRQDQEWSDKIGALSRDEVGDAGLQHRLARSEDMLRQIDLDQQVMNEWKGLLLDEELATLWPRFERHWRREAWLRARARMPSERVDLVQVVESLDLDWDAFINEKGDNVLEAALDSYAERMDALLLRLNDLLLEQERQGPQEQLEQYQSSGEYSRLLMEGLNEDGTRTVKDPARLNALRERRAEITQRMRDRRQKQFELRERIGRLNRLEYKAVLGMMPAEHAEAYQEAWLRQAMQWLWTRGFAATEAYAEQILAADDLTDAQRERIEQFLAEYRSQRVRLAESIVRHTEELWKVRMTTSRTVGYDPAGDYESKHVNPLLVRRYNLENEMIEQITHVLTEAQQERFSVPNPFDIAAITQFLEQN